MNEDPIVDSDSIDTGLPEPTLDEAGRLADEVPCRHCGYNLRGLPVDQPCPECTTPVGRSVRGDMLRFSDPAWVECLARGSRLYVLAIVIGFVLGLILGGAIAAMMAISGSIPLLGVIAIGVVVAFVTALQIWAYWIITTPDPGQDESSQPVTIRAVARYGLVLSTVFGFVGTLLDPNVRGMVFGQSNELLNSQGFRIGVLIVSGATAILSLVAIYALCEWARSLAKRVPDDKLARHTRIVMWGYIVPTALVQATAVLSAGLFPSGTGNTTPELILIGIMAVFGVPAAVFSVWGIVLVFWFRRRFFREADAARETWARPV